VAIVQRATSEDFAEIAALNVAAYKEFALLLGESDWAVMRGKLTDIDAVACHGEFWIVREEDEIVGSVAYCPPGKTDPLIPADWAAILLLAVRPSARRRGLARELVLACQRRAQEDQAGVIGLFTSQVMVAAQQLYERLGFRREADLPRRYGLRYWRYKLELPPGSASDSI
jgi:ribosomal protein S18 acetylase RimI-like enzyme